MTEIIRTDMAYDPLHHVLERLRPLDRREMFACRPHDDTHRVANELMVFCGNTGTLFWYDKEPVAAVGYLIMWPGVASVWAYGTPVWPKVVPAITRMVIRVLIPHLLQQNVHRAEARTLHERPDTGRWLTALGATHESVLFEYGRNRESFSIYAWSDHDQHRALTH